MPDLSALVCMSSFKGSLSNTEACDIVTEALTQCGITSHRFPIGDGGAGTLGAVQANLGGERISFSVTGPLGRAVEAQVLCLPGAGAPQSVYIESSQACGYHLVGPDERDAMRSSSYGLGELIQKVTTRWGSSAPRIYIGLGDTAVSDMGMGMLHALGFRFIDHGNKPLWGSADALRHIRTFELPAVREWEKFKFTILCDVLNPLLGAQGSARTFSAQKGATPGQIGLIEQGMENFSALLQKTVGYSARYEPMTGAAGGLAAAFLTCFPADLVLGARFLLDWLALERPLSEVTFAITGEGRSDSQTLAGKAPLECIERVGRRGKPVVLISGALGDGWEALQRKPGVIGAFACGQSPNAREALFRKTKEVFSEPTLLGTISDLTS